LPHINPSNGRNFTAPYKFVEYPKWVDLADGSRIVVHDEDEEAAAVGADASEAEDVREDVEERQRLFAEAKALGLNPHHKMKSARLRQLIESQS
jgi:hypothetical protein